MRYIFNAEPNWPLEIAYSMLGLSGALADEVVQGAASKGLDAKLTEKFLADYRKFAAKIENTVAKQTDRYSMLFDFVKPVNTEMETEDFIAVNFFALISELFMINDRKDNAVIECIPEKEDEGCNERIQDILNSYVYGALEFYTNTDLPFATAESDKVTSLDELINILTSISLADDLKMKFIYLYIKGIELTKDFISLVNKVLPACKNAYPLIAESYERSVAELTDTEAAERDIKNLIGLKLDFDKPYHLRISIFRFNAFTLLSSDGDMYGFIGMNMLFMTRYKDEYEKTTNNMSEEKITALLKALSEASRLKMIRMLAKKPMYMQEIANELNLTTATVSHHLSNLSQVNIIEFVVDNYDKKRVYYKLKADTLNHLADSISSIVKDGESL